MQKRVKKKTGKRSPRKKVKNGGFGIIQEKMAGIPRKVLFVSSGCATAGKSGAKSEESGKAVESQ